MDQYIIQFKEFVDYDLLDNLGVIIINKISCINCLTVLLNSYQYSELLNYGCRITKDSEVSL